MNGAEVRLIIEQTDKFLYSTTTVIRKETISGSNKHES